ncbi:MAG: hypothetical protein JXR76_04210 [Deltaproteobacteria bacterium]|nr:hypothetical protein [Deltaproteobacteria bacterium]
MNSTKIVLIGILAGFIGGAGISFYLNRLTQQKLIEQYALLLKQIENKSQEATPSIPGEGTFGHIDHIVRVAVSSELRKGLSPSAAVSRESTHNEMSGNLSEKEKADEAVDEDSEQSAVSISLGKNLVASAIEKGEWTMEDSVQLQELLRRRPSSDMQPVVQELILAINRQEISVPANVPLF